MVGQIWEYGTMVFSLFLYCTHFVCQMHNRTVAQLCIHTLGNWTNSTVFICLYHVNISWYYISFYGTFLVFYSLKYREYYLDTLILVLYHCIKKQHSYSNPFIGRLKCVVLQVMSPIYSKRFIHQNKITPEVY